MPSGSGAYPSSSGVPSRSSSPASGMAPLSPQRPRSSGGLHPPSTCPLHTTAVPHRHPYPSPHPPTQSYILFHQQHGILQQLYETLTYHLQTIQPVETASAHSGWLAAPSRICDTAGIGTPWHPGAVSKPHKCVAVECSSPVNAIHVLGCSQAGIVQTLNLLVCHAVCEVANCELHTGTKPGHVSPA